MLSASASHPPERSGAAGEHSQLAHCWCCRRSTFRLSVFVSFLLVYLCAGAICFMWIEAPYEDHERRSFREQRARFLQRHECVKDPELEAFIAQVVHGTERGVSVQSNATTMDANWSFGQSIFFSTTVVTTVGYGRTAPLSQGGKMFCVFFAMVGIPLTLILFTAIIERLSVPSEKLYHLMRRLLPESIRLVPGISTDFHVRVAHLVLILTIHVGIFTLVPAAIFDFIEEDWSYLDSVYFCFITWTTVGLGDFVPGEHQNQRLRPLYKILSSMYLFLSLISMLFVLKTFHDTPHLNLGSRVYMGSDVRAEEQMPLQPGDHGPKYTRQVDEASSTMDGLNDSPPATNPSPAPAVNVNSNSIEEVNRPF